LQNSFCKECCHIFFTRLPGQEFLIDYYKKEFSTKKKTPTVTKNYNYSAISDIVVNKINKNSKILDVGCGYGSAIKHFNSIGYKDIIGLEPSKLRSKIGKESNLNIINIPIDKLNKNEHGLFDLIYSWHAIEHIYDLYTALSNIRNVLKTDGYIFIAVPHFNAEHYFEIANFLPHVHNFNTISMKAILHRTGFEVEYIDDSLRVLAKKVDNPKDFNIKSEDRKKIINDISLKVIRDFDLLRRIPKNHSQLSFHISTTRASNQILEPSYGASRVLKINLILKI
jgi:Methylase involved in ubiquinone/menaquinone biosynthesis